LKKGREEADVSAEDAFVVVVVVVADKDDGGCWGDGRRMLLVYAVFKLRLPYERDYSTPHYRT
ncbi:MAG: hypothetical protein JNJ78_21350, partial [Anaerolineae bacterium]|nr:hypothetical protein [Anaerolineae bacterium]